MAKSFCKNNLICFIKRELMLVISFLCAIISLFITPPSYELIKNINWHTLGVLLMMLCVLCGFKKENIFSPIIKFALKIKKLSNISFFLIFSVFFSSMFVTNDISLLVFVPLTIIIFKNANQEKYIIPVIVLENVAAIRGSLLMPFGSPQNLFFFEKTQVSALRFILHMLPLSLASAVLLIIAILILHKNDSKMQISVQKDIKKENTTGNNTKKISYLILFAIVIWTIVSHTSYWYVSIIIVLVAVATIDHKIFLQVDYSLLITFLCFFIFSSSFALNANIASFLKDLVSENEYWWVIALSQIISNVPATIVLYPFSTNLAGLIYGADTAGLVSLIGSLASIIAYRIYKNEYPDNSKAYLKSFTLISWIFFMLMVFPGFLLSKVWTF